MPPPPSETEAHSGPEPGPDAPPDAVVATDRPEPAWDAVVASVKGAAHIRKGLPNEDATACGGTSWVSAAAVADGHGDASCPRAEVGSRLAAQAAVNLLLEWADAELVGAQPSPDAERVQTLLARDAVPKLVARWRYLVAADVAEFNLSPAEVAAVRRSEPQPEEATWDATGDSPDARPGESPVADDGVAAPTEVECWRAYGTTLVAALVCKGWVLVTQIGDGECGVVVADGHDVSPVPDDGVGGVATTSLAMPEAADVARVAALPTSDPPVAVWVCTDGFSGAQADTSWRQLVAEQLFELATTVGPGAVKEKLPGWLGPAASASGDDTSMVILIDKRLSHHDEHSPASDVSDLVVASGPTLPLPDPETRLGDESPTLSSPNTRDDDDDGDDDEGHRHWSVRGPGRRFGRLGRRAGS